jgi:hypothetical protein
MPENRLRGICRVLQPLGQEEASRLSDGVLYRIVRRDEKGRAFGTPRNPRAPTIEEFNPWIGEVPARELAGKITGRKHGIVLEQAERLKQLSNEELVRFRVDDPMSGHETDGGFSITGGHHRMNEIIRRVQAGEWPLDLPVRILFHD